MGHTAKMLTLLESDSKRTWQQTHKGEYEESGFVIHMPHDKQGQKHENTAPVADYAALTFHKCKDHQLGVFAQTSLADWGDVFIL